MQRQKKAISFTNRFARDYKVFKKRDRIAAEKIAAAIDELGKGPPFPVGLRVKPFLSCPGYWEASADASLRIIFVYADGETTIELHAVGRRDTLDRF